MEETTTTTDPVNEVINILTALELYLCKQPGALEEIGRGGVGRIADDEGRGLLAWLYEGCIAFRVEDKRHPAERAMREGRS